MPVGAQTQLSSRTSGTLTYSSFTTFNCHCTLEKFILQTSPACTIFESYKLNCTTSLNAIATSTVQNPQTVAFFEATGSFTGPWVDTLEKVCCKLQGFFKSCPSYISITKTPLLYHFTLYGRFSTSSHMVFKQFTSNSLYRALRLKRYTT